MRRARTQFPCLTTIPSSFACRRSHPGTTSPNSLKPQRHWSHICLVPDKLIREKQFMPFTRKGINWGAPYGRPLSQPSPDGPAQCGQGVRLGAAGSRSPRPSVAEASAVLLGEGDGDTHILSKRLGGRLEFIVLQFDHPQLAQDGVQSLAVLVGTAFEEEYGEHIATHLLVPPVLSRRTGQIATPQASTRCGDSGVCARRRRGQAGCRRWPDSSRTPRRGGSCRHRRLPPRQSPSGTADP